MGAREDSYIEVHAEQRVWTAVIARAVEEWASGPLRTRREAEAYLFGDQQDFPAVCRSAGLDPESLRRKLHKLRESGAGVPAKTPHTARYSPLPN